MTAINLVAAFLVSAAVLTAAPATADPSDPQPIPGFSAPGGGTWLPGVQQYPSVCSSNPLACGFHYDPDHGSWQQNPDNPDL